VCFSFLTNSLISEIVGEMPIRFVPRIRSQRAKQKVGPLGKTSLPVNGIDIGERDTVLRVGKGVTAARAGMSEGERRRTEKPSRCVPGAEESFQESLADRMAGAAQATRLCS
jgi:hypothetical protein